MINWFKEAFVPKYKPNKKEALILDVINGLCNHPETDIKMAPISGRYYLLNKELQYWVRVFPDGITITNHKFTFTNTAPQGFQDMIVRILEEAIEKSRDEFETTVFKNEVNLLENIVSNINNNTQK